jgi:superfamily II DNA/RNA helicase
MTDFASLAVAAPLRQALDAQGITQPTPVQAVAIPAIRDGQSILMQSQTGTGKTLAYLLPLLERLDTDSKQLQAVIMAPTHELCMQIMEQLRKLTAGGPVRSMALIGGAAIGRQIERLKDKPHVIVGSPGRLQELAALRRLKLAEVRTIVLDEVDRLLEPKSQPDLEAVIKQTLKSRQLVLVSATMGADVEAFATAWSQAPQTVRVDAVERPADTLSHQVLPGDPRDKIDTLRRLIRTLEPKAAMVFVKDHKKMMELLDKLNFKGLTVAALHSGERKLERVEVLKAFRSGKVQVLIATDIAARGLDLPNVELVVNFDLPVDDKAYLHRAGRTGRAGKSGLVISLVSNQDEFVIERYAKALGFTVAAARLYEGQLVPLTAEDRKRVQERKAKPKPAAAAPARPAGVAPAKPRRAKP